jgi:3-phosphoshikimate 1-carboxyvinyltransferase
MPLPDVIEIVPPLGGGTNAVTIPGSKSITNRALILAALASGEVSLRGALWSEDTQIMVQALTQLGFKTRVERDPSEPGNRFITVQGQGGKVPSSKESKTMALFVGNAGTAARFLPPILCLGSGEYRLSGVPRMHERPQGALFHALRQLGYEIRADRDRLPAVVKGGGPKQGMCEVSIQESSQFASGLLLCARTGGWDVRLTGENADESPYVTLTSKLIEAFPKNGGDYQIEPDASSGSYFWAANSTLIRPCETTVEQHNSVRNWPKSDWQIDSRFPEFLNQMSLAGDVLTVSRNEHLGDSIMTLIAIAPLSIRKTRFTDLGRLRHQECERVQALRTELQKCGAKVREHGDTLEIEPSPLHGAEIETYNDHRMAMCFAVLGLRVPGMKLRNPACVRKTFPDFFQKLAAPVPDGMAVTILDAGTGRDLRLEQLFAE